MNKAAIYAGTFDPMTLGHLDVVERAARIFDRLVLAVAESAGKSPLFSLEERSALCQRSVVTLRNVEVDTFSGLLVDYVHAKGVHVILRGLRAFSDFEYEFQMALTNRKLAPDLETLFLMPKEDYSYLSSRMVREVAEMGGDICSFVPEPVAAALQKRLTSKAVHGAGCSARERG